LAGLLWTQGHVAGIRRVLRPSSEDRTGGTRTAGTARQDGQRGRSGAGPRGRAMGGRRQPQLEQGDPRVRLQGAMSEAAGMAREFIQSGSRWEELAGYSRAVIDGEW